MQKVIQICKMSYGKTLNYFFVQGDNPDHIEPDWTIPLTLTLSSVFLVRPPCQTDPFKRWPKKTDGDGIGSYKYQRSKSKSCIVQHHNYEFKYEPLELILMSVWRTAWLKGCVRKVHPLVADWSRIHAFKACESKSWCDRGNEESDKQCEFALITSTQHIMEIHLFLIHAISEKHSINGTLHIPSRLPAREHLF